MILKRMSILIMIILVVALPVLIIGSALADQEAVAMPTLTITPISSDPVDAGKPAVFKVVLANPTGQNQPGLYLDLNWDETLIDRARIEIIEGESGKYNSQGLRRSAGRARWLGGIRAGGQLTLEVTLLPILCYNDPLDIKLDAEVGAVNGGPLDDAQASVVASCPDNQMTAADFTLDTTVAPSSQLEIEQTATYILNGLDALVRIDLTNDSDKPMNALVTDQFHPGDGLSEQCRVRYSEAKVETRGAPTLTFDRGYLSPGTSQNAADENVPFIGFMVLELKPGATWTAVMQLPLQGREPGCDFSGMATVYPAPAQPIPGSCDGGSPNCRYRGWTRRGGDLQRLFNILDGYDSNQIKASLVASDLGDAPTSKNNANTDMSAYTDVTANFPTVFNFNIGMPPTLNAATADHGDAPLHLYTYPMRLGNLASIEAEADWPPNRNIDPVNDRANLDNRDDALSSGALPDSCQPFDNKIKITVEQWALDYFADKGGTAYLNLLVDANGDGDWEDAGSCGGSAAPEHLIVNHPIDIKTLGLGQHEIDLPVNKGVQWQTDQTWLRLTLGEQKAPLHLRSGGIDHGDGAGPEGGYLLGETEDYRLRVGPGLDAPAAPGADVAVRLSSSLDVLANHGVPSSPGNYQIQATTGCLTCIDPCLIGNIFVRLGNLGDQTATGGRLTVFPDPSFRSSSPDITVQGDLPWIGDLSTEVACSKGDPDCRVNIDLGDIPPGQFGSLVVVAGHQCDGDDVACQKKNFNVKARINANGDENNKNNQATDQVRLSQTPQWIVPPRITIPLPGTTSDSGVKVMGVGQSGRIVDVFLNGKKVGTGNTDADGRFLIHVLDVVEMFESATYELSAAYRPPAGSSQTRPRTIVIDDTGYSIKPNTLQFSFGLGGDNYGFAPWDPTGRLDVNGWQVPLIAGVETTGSTEHHWWCLTCTLSLNNLDMTLQIDDKVLATLTDPEGDGSYTGKFTPGQADIGKQITLHAREEGIEQVFQGQTVAAELPRLIDSSSGQPIPGKSVTLWQLVRQGNDSAVWTRPLDINGQPNPRTTEPDGSFFFNVPDGVYRLQVNNKGFHDGQFTEPQRLFGIYPRGDVLVNASGSTVVNHQPHSVEGKEILVKMTADGFNPPQVMATTGDRITFQNVSLQQRGVSGEDGSLNGVLFGPGQSYTVSFAKAGELLLHDLQSPQNKMRVLIESSKGGQIMFPIVLSQS